MQEDRWALAHGTIKGEILFFKGYAGKLSHFHERNLIRLPRGFILSFTLRSIIGQTGRSLLKIIIQALPIRTALAAHWSGIRDLLKYRRRDANGVRSAPS
jgi:hypothetical protein